MDNNPLDVRWHLRRLWRPSLVLSLAAIAGLALTLTGDNASMPERATQRVLKYITHLDYATEKFVNGIAQHSFFVDRIVDHISSMDLLKGIVFIAAFWWIWFSRTCPPGLAAEGNRMFVVRSILAGLVGIGLGRCLQQMMPERLRPMHDPQLGFQLPYGARPKALEGWSSFPSDHAVLFFGLATAIWLWSRAWGAIAFLWALLIVCIPRIYMGYHYPSDIIAGALLGMVTMVAVQRIPAPPGAVAAIRRYETGYPSAFYTLAFLLSYEIATLFDSVRELGSSALTVLGMAR
jgi:undecaprenyl-diphosphatase